MTSDQALLREFAASRDGELFAELVRRHGGMVYGVCRRVLGDRTLAEDAAQETFLHLLRHPAAASDSLIGWLHRVAHGKSVDLVRREAAQARHRKAAPPPEPAAEASWSELSPLMDQALLELPEQARVILVRHFLAGLSQQDLAAELGLSQPTVSRRLAEAVAALREILARKGVVATLVAFTAMLQANACESAPATLAAELGKMALASHVGLGAPAVSGAAAKATAAKGAAGMSFAMKVVVWSVVVAGGIAAGMALPSSLGSGMHVRPPLPEWRFVAADLGAMAPLPAPEPPSDRLGVGGPARLLSLSPLGGSGDDEVVGVGITPDWSVVVAGNAVDLAMPGVPETVVGADLPERSAHGYIARFAPDGRSARSLMRFGAGQATIERLRVDPRGDLLVLGVNRSGGDLGGGPGRGDFVAKFSADASRMLWILYRERIADVATDADGDVLVLAGDQLTRYDSATGARRWNATWPGRGGDHAAAIGVAADGVAVVVGEALADAGGQRFHDPYARAFARDGRALWRLWDADPRRVAEGALHLNADGFGKRAIVLPDGGMLLAMASDGGNTVLAHDPADPGRPLPAAAIGGVHQDGPGFGFSGATRVGALFRVASRDGALVKTTWMSSWRTPAQAGAWALEDIAADDRLICAVGTSAATAPAKAPWFAAAPGAAQGGGSVAIFSHDLALLQTGCFPHTRFTCVAQRGGLLVVGGRVRDAGDDRDPVRSFHPWQTHGGGGDDGCFAVFALDRP